MIDLNFYAWRVPVVEDGVERLLVPHSDPHEHEFPFDLIFGSSSEAHETLAEYGYDEEAEEEGWVLVYFNGIRFDPPFDDSTDV